MADPTVKVWRLRHCKVRRFLKIAKWFLGLALLILEILKHLLDLIRESFGCFYFQYALGAIGGRSTIFSEV